MKTALITGITGQDGAYLARLLLSRGYRVDGIIRRASTFNTDRIDALYHDPHDPDVRMFLHYGDLTDGTSLRRIVETVQPDEVYNLAAQSHVKVSFDQPEYTADVVFTGTLRVLEALRDYSAVSGKAVKIYQAGSSEMFGAAPAPQNESTPFHPRSPYAASKAGGDRLAYAYWCTYGLPVVVTRCSNNYGPRQYPEKLVPLFVTNAIDDEPLPVYGNGLNRRDWLHVDDHCDALLTLLTFPGIEGETFNIGAQHELDVLTITGTLLELLGKPASLIRHVEDRPGHDRRYAVDSSKLTRVTGWTPRIPFADGIRGTVEWFQQNTAWWRPIKQGEFRAYYERMYGQRKVLKAVRG